MGRGWNNLEVLDKKAEIALMRLWVEVWVLKVILVRAQKEEMVVKASIILENAYITINRLLVKIRTLKMLLMRSEGNEKQAIGN